MNHLKTHQTNPTTAQYRPVQSNTSTAQYSQVQPIPEPDPKPELFGQTRPEPDPKSKSPTRQSLVSTLGVNTGCEHCVSSTYKDLRQSSFLVFPALVVSLISLLCFLSQLFFNAWICLYLHVIPFPRDLKS